MHFIMLFMKCVKCVFFILIIIKKSKEIYKKGGAEVQDVAVTILKDLT